MSKDRDEKGGTARNPSRASEDGGSRSVIEPRFLTLDDVATYLNVSVPQVYALVRSGALPAIKIGGRGIWRVDKGQLEAYIERLHESTQEWAMNHPLNPSEKGGPSGSPRKG